MSRIFSDRLSVFVKKNHYLVVLTLLVLMFGLGVGSMAHDSAIVDEVAHIPAGYSYLHYGDYRLNPEHPPLIKSLAALPLQFMKLTFPVDNPSWTTDINGQWDTGWNFIYHYGNNADRILFYARLPILVLSVVFAGVFYELMRRKFGIAVGLLAVFLYTLEPNILAHSRLVTTDIGVTAFIFLAVWGFVRYLERPSFRTGAAAAVLLALAQLSKFSAVILAPLYIILLATVVFAWGKPKDWVKRLWSYGSGFVLIGISALVMVWLVYIPLTWNTTATYQRALVTKSLSTGWKLTLASKLASYNNIPGVKALMQYVLGLFMVLGRVAGGNTTYLLGHVSNQSFWWYFPITYLIKTPVALLIMILLGVIAALVGYFRHTPWQFWANFRRFSAEHFFRLAAILFVGIYAFTSITGNLNLGIRHLLPMFPFIFVLVAYAMVSLYRKFPRQRRLAAVVAVGLALYYLVANLAIYPSYLAYFNELIGGPGNAYKYVSDSSVDWGQDLVRLRDYVQDQHIQHIAVDYFGGGLPQYYFCTRVYTAAGQLIKNSSGYDCKNSPFIEWHAQNGLYHGYMAVSETFLENDLYYAKLRGDSGYTKLRQMKPIAKIGYSIYIFKVQ